MQRNKRVILIITAVLIICAVAGLIVIPKIIRSNRYTQAASYAEHGLYDEAIELFSRVNGYKDSDSYMDYCLLRKAVAAGNYSEAGQYAERIPEFKDASAYLSLSECHAVAETGDLETAIENAANIELSEAKTLLKSWQSEYAQEQNARAEEAMRQEDWDQAKAYAEHALQYCDDSQLEKLLDDSISRIHERDYDRSIAMIRDRDFDDALTLLETLDGYSDSAQILSHLSQGAQGKAYAYALVSEETDSHVLASLYSEAGEYADAAERAQEYQDQADAQDYELAQSYLADSKWQEAKQVFSSLGDYQESAVFEKVCENGLRQEEYDEAMQLMEKGDYEAAEQAFLALGSYQDSAVRAISCREAVNAQKYSNAMQLIEAHEYEKAYEIFTELGDYRDSRLMCHLLEMEGLSL